MFSYNNMLVIETELKIVQHIYISNRAFIYFNKFGYYSGLARTQTPHI